MMRVVFGAGLRLSYNGTSEARENCPGRTPSMPFETDDPKEPGLTRFEQFRLAAGFLTRLPVPPPRKLEPRALATAAWAFPVVGLGVGTAGGLVYVIASNLGLTAFLAALLAVAVQILITGALHEDGLADVADGFGGGGDRARKLEIMRDSRLGSYGALALFLATAARIGAIAALGTFGAPAVVFLALMAAGAASRTAAVALMVFLEPARPDGLGASAGRPGREGFIAAGIFSAVAAFIALGLGGGIAALLVSAAAVWALAKIARRQIGGQTGDVLGAAQQISEIAFLIAAVAVA
jgi:adenosylcobinamide-GDP ribazoletransferase